MDELNMTCDDHNWTWDVQDGYGCPVCEGIRQERERVTALLKDAVVACVKNGDCAYCDATKDHIYTINKEDDHVED